RGTIGGRSGRMTITIQSIAEAIGASSIDASGPGLSGSVSGWSIDSRTLNPGDCFFALRGSVHDGHQYIAGLAAKGAALAIVEERTEAPTPQLVVRDTTIALQQLAAWARRHWAGTVVGVTGSAGKTTTKDAIAKLLAVAMKTGRTIGNYNNQFGVPLSILRLADDCQAAVIEMGMNH